MSLRSQPERSGWNRGGSGNKYHHLYLSCAGSHTYAGNDDSGADSHTGSWKLEVNVKFTPAGNFTDGPVRLRLGQNVNGQNVETVLMDGETITFPQTVILSV